MFYLRPKKRIIMCRMRMIPEGEREEDGPPFERVDDIYLEVGKVYPLIEVKNPFRPDEYGPWLTMQKPSLHLQGKGLEEGDMVGLGKQALLNAPRSLFEIMERAETSRSPMPMPLAPK